MNVTAHHSLEQLQQLYRCEKNSRPARRMQGAYLACKGLTCPQIMEITGAARRTIQQWIVKYNAGGIEALKELSRPGRPTKLPRNKEQQFRRRIEAGPSKENGIAVLSGLSIRRILEHFNLLCSHCHFERNETKKAPDPFFPSFRQNEYKNFKCYRT